jgi:hypothetical protein
MRVSSVKIENWKSFADTGEIALDNINVLVGRNNSGKSAFLRVFQLMQQGFSATAGDIRLDAPSAQININLADDDLTKAINRHYRLGIANTSTASLTMTVYRDRVMERRLFLSDTNAAVEEISATEPQNFIYTYLSKRKVIAFEQPINAQRTLAVEVDLRNLNAKVNRLVSPDYEGFDEYTNLCNKVLGFRVGTFASTNGHQSGISVGRFGHIPLESMGEGVSSQLGLITNLCMADGNLFLIEEPENDIHPESLKALLDVIIEKSTNNQFIVTTHSNIVTRYLGAADNSKVFAVEVDFAPNSVPTSTIREVERTPDARIAVLRQLGYELSDFDLWDGWLILEESSAEFFIRGYLIPWFVPRLGRIRTVAAGGTSKVEPLFADYQRLFLFAHLEPQYKGRAWVIVDGEPSGNNVVERLKKDFRDGWPPDHFRTFSKADFEQYYPGRFRAEIDEALGKHGQEKRDAKKALVKKVADWCDANTEAAKIEFSGPASEVIGLLEEIDLALFGSAG